MYKVGFGFDSHKFKEGNFIILGGVKIDHYQSIEAHSDGDLIIHALSDALLGAAGLGDLGSYFQGSEKDKGISGRAILSEILEKIKKYHIINFDICVITEEPKLKPYAAKIEESLSSLLHIERNKINFKSKTNDGMGFIGRSEGIAVFANVLIKNKWF